MRDYSVWGIVLLLALCPSYGLVITIRTFYRLRVRLGARIPRAFCAYLEHPHNAFACIMLNTFCAMAK